MENLEHYLTRLEDYSVKLDSIAALLWILHNDLDACSLHSEIGAVFLAATDLSDLCKSLDDDIAALYKINRAGSGKQ